MWIRNCLIALMLVCCAQFALAAPRTFPQNAQRGTISGNVFPQVLINNQIQRLAPGAKILNEQNLIIMPSTLFNKVYIVNFTFDRQGLIDRVWILTNEELTRTP